MTLHFKAQKIWYKHSTLSLKTIGKNNFSLNLSNFHSNLIKYLSRKIQTKPSKQTADKNTCWEEKNLTERRNGNTGLISRERILDFKNPCVLLLPIEDGWSVSLPQEFCVKSRYSDSGFVQIYSAVREVFSYEFIFQFAIESLSLDDVNKRDLCEIKKNLNLLLQLILLCRLFKK